MTDTADPRSGGGRGQHDKGSADARGRSGRSKDARPKELGRDGITPLVDADRALRVREIGHPTAAMRSAARSTAARSITGRRS
ncbi:hypothetical protein FAM15061_001512 [Propionibacterium freudenreichii]|uniref:hypothetical protein n=1 Tax=Propionibacterium freudenreichii TaxID=1744 RepID=UPI0021A7D2E9|nr:hypothetical protein [Propionibacterium freudenreichii]MDK9611175.1 hypothetical protein [Propionibacterium freudenreichii]MDK9620566.1 hypothetical protein [Propionibacterium freudenreichii]MDK9623506.1 hypothetical protein [Propionibacterium freudenreichii]